MRPGDAFDDVLTAARAGADWAWARIYDDLAPKVTGYLRAHGAPDPEDVAGEVFLQVVRDLPGFEGDEREFRAWLFTIAHRRLVDALRYRTRRPVDAAPDDVVASAAGLGGDVPEEAQERIADAKVRQVPGRGASRRPADGASGTGVSKKPIAPPASSRKPAAQKSSRKRAKPVAPQSSRRNPGKRPGVAATPSAASQAGNGRDNTSPKAGAGAS